MSETEAEMRAGSFRVKLYVSAILLLCVLSVVLVLGLTFLRPEADNVPTIAIVLGIFTPIVGGLMAAALKENHDATNSRLSQLVELTEKSAHAEGKLNGQTPATPLGINKSPGVTP